MMKPNLLTTDEAAVACQIVDLACEEVRGAHPPVRGDAHVKHHGIVLAELFIRADIPTDLRHGLFAAPPAAGYYPAYIRFSNAASRVQSDDVRDAHGMAIKLLGVQGAKLLDDGDGGFDLLLVDHPIFFLSGLRVYLQFLRAMNGPWWKKAWFLFHLETLWRMIRSISRIPSPLSTTYFSMTAYKLGPQSVKLLARPVGPPPNPLPAVRSDDYLRRTMARELETDERYFDLCVQLRTDPEVMPDDDATVEWSANDARPIPVATIRIPQQRFDSRAQMEFAEAISFNPWRVTAEHAPLGRINFLRGAVYGAVATLRQQRLGAAWPPPALHDWSYFANSLLARKGSMPASRADPAPRADPASSIPP